MKTVIVADKNGQAGNQLFLFAHFISNAIEYNYRLYFPAFYDLSTYFEKTSLNRYDKYPINGRISRYKVINDLFLFLFRYFVALLYRILPKTSLYSVIRLYLTNDKIPYAYYNMETEKDYLVQKPFLFLQGWSFRSPSCVAKHHETIRTFFHLKQPMKKKIDDLISSYKKQCDVLVGVHIRRGDYTKFMEGTFYYENPIYENYMQQVLSLMPGKKIGFVVCSNENVTVNHPSGSNVFYPQGIFIEDLYTLAGCDYIIGPPSTFSQWASYYGNKPIKILFKPDEEIKSINEFLIASL